MPLELVPSQPMYIAGLIWLGVFLLAILAASMVQSRAVLRRRITSQSTLGDRQTHDIRRSLGFQDQIQASSFMERAGRLFAFGDASDSSATRKQLIQAGFFSPSAVHIYQGVRVVGGICLALSFPLIVVSFSFRIPAIFTLPAVAALCVVGLILPSILLDWRKAKLRKRYQNVFPDFMDLMVVCVESGQSLPAALERVATEIVRFSPELGTNLHLVNLELRAGRTLTESLSGLYERVGLDEVKSLNLLLKQSEELGASIADTLRVFSDDMRDKRLMRAETRAHALPVKMTLPLGLFIFPTILMVILVPVAIRLNASFF